MQGVCWSLRSLWTLIVGIRAALGLNLPLAITYTLDTVLLVLLNIPGLNSWWGSVSQGSPFITEKIVAAQPSWHSSPLKHDHIRNPGSPVFWPTSVVDPVNRHLDWSHWQHSENLNALWEINHSDTGSFGGVTGLNKISHHLLTD